MSAIIFGIQGGPGSFNDLALQEYLSQNPTPNHQVKYLHTSANVMTALAAGNIDRGQMALRNSLGGEVVETTQALAQSPHTIIAQYQIKITHALMMRPDAELNQITTIMAHHFRRK
jgi:prephenate dehydratase